METAMSERDWWDGEAVNDERYATLRWGGDGTPEAVEPTMRMIIENLCSVRERLGKGPMTVLEIGCGPGRLLHRMARLHPHDIFIGIDISQAMLDLGRDDRPMGVITSSADLPMIGYDDVDMIYSVEVFQHIDEFTKAEYLGEIASALRPGGLALIQHVTDATEGWMSHPWDDASFTNYAIAAGLKIVKWTVPNKIHEEWSWRGLRK